jgi:hypothetical protein
VTLGLSLLATACSSGPAKEDVQAARACEAFYLFARGFNTGARALAAAQQIVPGSSGAPAAHASHKWAPLGRHLIAAIGAAFTGDNKKLNTEGNAASEGCARIPSAAKVAGRFETSLLPTRSHSPSPTPGQSSPPAPSPSTS